jgi:hypothetical protein
MRSLRGEKVVPLVNLTERPMKSKRFGTVPRPHLEVIGWKSPGGGTPALPTTPSPTLPSPGSAAVKPTNPPADKPAPKPADKPKPKPKAAAKAKPPIHVDGMTDVKPPTTAELLDDEIPF